MTMIRYSLIMNTAALIILTITTCLIHVSNVDSEQGGFRAYPSSQYQIRQRLAQGAIVAETIITIDQIQDYVLTFSDESEPKRLSPLLLILYDTDRTLTNESLETIAMGLENFLLAELNAVYAPSRALEDVHVSFPSQLRDGLRNELLTNVNVTFRHEPSPSNDQIEVWLQTIFSNMTYFIKNLTSLINGRETDLASITSAYILPYLENVEQDDKVAGIEDNVEGYKGRSIQSVSSIVVPSIVITTLAVFLIGIFIVDRRHVHQGLEPTEQESRSLKSKSAFSTGQKDILQDDDDNFSFEISLLESPVIRNPSPQHESTEVRVVKKPSKRQGSASSRSMEIHEKESDIFSGIFSFASPRNLDENRSLFSFLSCFTDTSTSTVRHSNLSKENARGIPRHLTKGNKVATLSKWDWSPAGGNTGTPRSRVSSLFAFSEENENEDEKSCSNTEIVPIDEERPPVDDYIIMNPTDGNANTLTSLLANKAEDLTCEVHSSFNSKSVDSVLTPSTKEEIENKSNLLRSKNRRGRRHAKSTAEDGTEAYQNEAMQPIDWSPSEDKCGGMSVSSPSDQTLKHFDEHYITTVKKKNTFDHKIALDDDNDIPQSQMTNKSIVSALSFSPNIIDSSQKNSLNIVSSPSPSRKLIDDFVWLEKKIAGTTKSIASFSPTPRRQEKEVAPAPFFTAQSPDSISFQSRGTTSIFSKNSLSSIDLNEFGEKAESGVRSIVCRNCFAPPGNLKIIINSTKDGPIVHTVKPGSSLEGHIFPGDLIISIDNVDTRSCTAEQAVEMMSTRAEYERKITVLHFISGDANN